MVDIYVGVYFVERRLAILDFEVPDSMDYPLVNIQKAIENDHRNSEFSHEKRSFCNSYFDITRGLMTSGSRVCLKTVELRSPKDLLRKDKDLVVK